MATKAVKAGKKDKTSLGKTPSHSELVQPKAEPCGSKYNVWPYWSDTDLAAEKWDYSGGKPAKADKSKSPTPVPSQGGLYEDPLADRLVLPISFEGKKTLWKRPSVYLADKGIPVMVMPENLDACDLVRNNHHLLIDPVMCKVITELQLVFKLAQSCKPADVNPKGTATPGGRGGAKQPVSTEPTRLGVDATWRPWDHIYPRTKGNPVVQYNASGKYAVRLFWLGHWRKVIVDDLLPFNTDHLILLPMTAHTVELWSAVLCKAILKLASLEYARFKTDIPDPYNFSVVHMLSGWMPAFPPMMDKWCMKASKEPFWNFLKENVPESAQGPCRMPGDATPTVDQTPGSERGSSAMLSDVKPSKTARGKATATALDMQTSKDDRAPDGITACLGELLKDPYKVVTAEMPWPPKQKRFTSKIKRDMSIETALEVIAKLGIPTGVGQSVIVLAVSSRPTEAPVRPDPLMFKKHFEYMGFKSEAERNRQADEMYEAMLSAKYQSVQVCFTVAMDTRKVSSTVGSQTLSDGKVATPAKVSSTSIGLAGKTGEEMAATSSEAGRLRPGLQYRSVWITAKVFRRLFTWFRVYHRPTGYLRRQSICDFQYLSCGTIPPVPTPAPPKKESRADKASTTSITSQAQVITIEMDHDEARQYIYADLAQPSTLCIGLSAYLPWQSVPGHPRLPLPSVLERLSTPQHALDTRTALPGRATSAEIVASEAEVANTKRCIEKEAKQQNSMRMVVSRYDWFDGSYTNRQRTLHRLVDIRSASVSAACIQLSQGRHILEIDRHQFGIASQIDVWLNKGTFLVVPEAGLWKLLSQPSIRLMQYSNNLSKAVISSLSDFPNFQAIRKTFFEFGVSLAPHFQFNGKQSALGALLKEAIPKSLKMSLKEKCDDDVLRWSQNLCYMAIPQLLHGLATVKLGPDPSRTKSTACSAEETEAALMIQTNIRQLIAREYVKAVREAKKQKPEDFVKLKTCATDLASCMDAFGQSCWRHVMYEDRRLLDHLPFASDERCHGILTEYSGQLPELPVNTWTPLFRESFIVHRPQHLAFSLDCGLPSHHWKMVVIDNDKPCDSGANLLHTPRPSWFVPNTNGYTFMAFGRSLNDAIPSSKYKFQLLASSSPVPTAMTSSPKSDIASVASGPGAMATAFPTALSIRTIRALYYPETEDLRMFRMVLLAQQDQKLTFHILLSNRAAVVKLKLYDGDEVIREAVGHKGEARMDLVLLDAVPVLAASAAAVMEKKAALELARLQEEAAAAVEAAEKKGARHASAKKGQGKAGKGGAAKKPEAAAKGAKLGTKDGGEAAAAGATAATGEVPTEATEGKPSSTAADGGVADATSSEPTSAPADGEVAEELSDSDESLLYEDDQESEILSPADIADGRKPLHDGPFKAGETSFLTGARKKNRRRETYDTLLKQEIDDMFREFDKPLERPETHKYILEGYVLGGSWPLEESAWHASFGLPHPTKQQGSLGVVQDLNPAGKSRPQSSLVADGKPNASAKGGKKPGKKEISRTKSVAATSGVYSSPDLPKDEEGQDAAAPVDTTKPHWTLKIVYDSSAKEDIDVKYDTTGEERLDKWKKRMDDACPGRMKKGEELRDEWIRERLNIPDTDLEEASTQPSRYGDPLWGAPGHDTAQVPKPDLSGFLRPSLPVGETVRWSQDDEESARDERWNSLEPVRRELQLTEDTLPKRLLDKEQRKFEQRQELNELFVDFQATLDRYETARDTLFVSKGHYSLEPEKPPEPTEPPPSAAEKKGKGKDAKKGKKK